MLSVIPASMDTRAAIW